MLHPFKKNELAWFDIKFKKIKLKKPILSSEIKIMSNITTLNMSHPILKTKFCYKRK